MLVYTDGETVIAQDEVPDAVYVIASGTLHVTRSPEDEVIAELFLAEHEAIGVSSSMSRQQASHTRFFCDGDVTLIRIPHDAVDTCVQANARLAHEFARVYEVRSEALDRARDEFERGQAKPDDQLLPVRMRKPQDEDEPVGES